MKPIEIVLLWLGVFSLILFVMMGLDKTFAKHDRRRIPEKRLFLFALLGGAIGGTAGMRVFRHKTKHWYFAWGFPFIALVQICGVIYYFYIR